MEEKMPFARLTDDYSKDEIKEAVFAKFPGTMWARAD
jgi:hypothetical protein